MQTDTLTAACLGKIPTHGDFVSHRASTPTMRAYDDWMRKGLYRARQSSSGWKDDFHDAPPMRFVFSPRDGSNLLVGTLRPSSDESGRAYPFTVACEVPKSAVSAQALPYLPFQADPFFRSAEQVVTDAVEGDIPVADVSAHVERLDPSFGAPSSVPRGMQRRLERETVEDLAADLFGRFDDPRTLRLFYNLTVVVKPLRTGRVSRLDYGMAFPIGRSNGAEARTTTACFWLDAGLRLADRPRTDLSFFWTAPRTDDDRAALTLFVGQPRQRAIPSLFDFGDSDAVCHLDTMDTGDDPAQALDDRLRDLLSDRSLSLWNLLDHLSDLR